MRLGEIEDTRDIKIPKNPIDRIVGQARAVEKVRLALRQRRHLLLVGPPGIGKSMLAQALALNLPKPNQEVRIVHNDGDPERPLLEVVDRLSIEKEAVKQAPNAIWVAPEELPCFVAEQLGFRCRACGTLSSDRDMICPGCGVNKYVCRGYETGSQFNDLITEICDMSMARPEREVQVLKTDKVGRDKVYIYRKIDGGRVQIIDKASLEAPKKQEKKAKILVPLNRVPFVQATGASETELLGDVRHDPFGSHPEIGTPAYQRIIPGAVHEAHEGVLFIDELPQIQGLQTYLLTAMQEKKYSIIGRNPHSSGAAVKVNDVPCDFLFVGACNIADLDKILPPLRSRILGAGYEVLLETVMPDTDENQMQIAQFIAQEIESDKRIPPASSAAIEELVRESRRQAVSIDNAKNCLSLRLRGLGGIIRYAGDLAIQGSAPLIEADHIKKAVVEAKPIEHQIKESYGSLWKGLDREKGASFDQGGAEGYR